MANIFVNRENSGWIFDNIHDDYIKHTQHNVVNMRNADICWFLNPWGYFKYARELKVPSFVHIHHIDESKVSQWRFDLIDQFATGCIVPNRHTETTLKKYVKVPVYRFPYWVLTKMAIDQRNPIIDKTDGILIGSFQKDSEGNTDKPKMSKGPDIFLKVLEKLIKKHKIKIILTGYNRGYMIKGLINLGIPFEYRERTNDLSGLYDSLDWYFVTSRTEGGPQSVLEASARKVKILSTDVGIASEVLHPDCICNDIIDFVDKFERNVDRIDDNYNSVVEKFNCQLIVRQLDDFFEKRLR